MVSLPFLVSTDSLSFMVAIVTLISASVFIGPSALYIPSASYKDTLKTAFERWSYSEIPGEDEFGRILLKSLQYQHRHVASYFKEAFIQ